MDQDETNKRFASLVNEAYNHCMRELLALESKLEDQYVRAYELLTQLKAFADRGDWEGLDTFMREEFNPWLNDMSPGVSCYPWPSQESPQEESPKCPSTPGQ
jgi:hypothetical protein